jgi:hypothetical protein
MAFLPDKSKNSVHQTIPSRFLKIGPVIALLPRRFEAVTDNPCWF